MSIQPLLLNTYDRAGGAAIAAYRLHTGLRQSGINSQMVVGYKFGDDPTVIKASTDPLGRMIDFLRPSLDSLPLTPYPKRQHNTLSFEWLPDRLAAKIDRWQPDLLHLHWIGSGFVQIEALAQFHKPICWTLHDMWAFTGGCHYSDGCDRYLANCGSCPILNSNKADDATRWVWQRKQAAWQELQLQIITPSYWLADLARRSSLLRDMPIAVIPNGLDTDIYQPQNRQWAKQQLDLPTDKQLILFGALYATSDRRKGFDLLTAALAQLPEEWRDQVILGIFGATAPKNPPDFGFPARYLGEINSDEQLAMVYAAADVFVLPSREDNLPNTILEALACGTPCVSFGIGGIPEAIDDRQNGYIAEPFDPIDLAHGIVWVLMQNAGEIGSVARAKALREYALPIQAQRYQEIYESLLV
jgi:glycosyltransferase involved in cell wall biosynthesis